MPKIEIKHNVYAVVTFKGIDAELLSAVFDSIIYNFERFETITYQGINVGCVNQYSVNGPNNWSVDWDEFDYNLS
jgi:hypothetical protein